MQEFIVGVPRCNEPDDVLAETLQSILLSSRQPCRILVVDNGDVPLSDRVLLECQGVSVDVVRPQRNLGCAGAWNLLHRLASPVPLVLVNADCAVAEDTFACMLASPAPVVLAYAFGCFRIDEPTWRTVGEFDEAFYPVYFEDADYRRRLAVAGVIVDEWSTQARAVVRPGRERAATGIEHGKHDPDGYQGWRGAQLAWFHERVAANRAYYLRKWGGEPGQEVCASPCASPGASSEADAAADAPVPALLSPRVVVRSRVIPPWDLGSVACAPLGLPMCQNRLAIATWSYAMERHPPARIVEIGTYGGGFTIALGVHARQIGARVVTYDVSRAPDDRLADLGRLLGIQFRMADVFAVEAEIAQLIASPGVTYVLCDGGSKRRELATFARYCKPGDVIGAHDYHVEGSNNAWWGWGEISVEDGGVVAAEHGLDPWLQDHFDTAAWLVYRKR